VNRTRTAQGRFGSESTTRGRGRVGEDAGVAWLRRRGYEIVERNHSTRIGEIDVIARDDRVLCFIEIKARTDDSFGSPLAAVTRRKQRQIARVASLYLVESEYRGSCRFDVLGMELDQAGEWRFQLIQNAFEAPAET
jgi:putative endonuclease